MPRALRREYCVLGFGRSSRAPGRLCNITVQSLLGANADTREEHFHISGVMCRLVNDEGVI